MARIIKSGLIQMSLPITEGEGSIEEIKQAMLDKHIPYIEEAGKKGVQILCLQEIWHEWGDEQHKPGDQLLMQVSFGHDS